MRLLIVTQKVDIDDPVLGFFHRWIIEFAKHFDTVKVVCLQKGLSSLPGNVEVYSLGKEVSQNKLKYAYRFLSFIIRKRNEYDVVFVHMNPIYLVMAGWFWNIFYKPAFLWYSHKSVDTKLRIAEIFAKKIFTTSKESLHLITKKAVVVGHGIDVSLYEQKETYNQNPVVSILTIGRITPIKDHKTLVLAADLLRNKWRQDFKITVVGDTVSKEDEKYKDEIIALIKEKDLQDYIVFSGNVTPEEIPYILADSDMTINLTPTGGMDKVVLESFAAGVPAFSANQAFSELYGEYKNFLSFDHGDSEDLAAKIQLFWEKSDKNSIVEYISVKVLKEFSVESLISKIYSNIETNAASKKGTL